MNAEMMTYPIFDELTEYYQSWYYWDVRSQDLSGGWRQNWITTFKDIKDGFWSVV